MKKQHLAFTLIELLIVVSIIAIVTWSGLFYWFKQLSSIELSNKTKKVVDIIDNLDGQIYSKEIIDYTLLLDINKNKYWLDYSVNTLWLDYIQELDFDSEILSWTLSSTQNWWTGSFVIKHYVWIKYIWEDIIQWWWTLVNTYAEGEDYKITSTLSGQTLNDIFVSYYDVDNIGTDDENKLELIELTSQDWNTSYSTITIENKNGQKSITWNNWNNLDSFSMKFEKQWAQHTIIITK